MRFPQSGHGTLTFIFNSSAVGRRTSASISSSDALTSTTGSTKGFASAGFFGALFALAFAFGFVMSTSDDFRRSHLAQRLPH